MLERCYSEKFQEQHPTYKDCIVCEEWLNYQNFAKWYEDNYYKIGNETMNLDKDILHKGNKIYSPETCVFISHNINSLFTKRQNDRGNYPLGVKYVPKYNNYQSRCNDGNNKSIHLGTYNTSLEAFLVYKNYKEKIIKQIADKYKKYIPQNLYRALYKYEVEITD